MRAHYLQHVPFEGLGSIAPWLDRAGYTITRTPLYQSTDLPDPATLDLLIVMGGPMSVNDAADYPWLVEEKNFIRAAIQAGKPVLGICLGAQLIASALGAKVYPSTAKEIGWFPVQGVPAGEGGFRFPESVEVFHWHGETFDLPAGATLLASSPACQNQAFQLGARVIGLQFHLETTPDTARAIAEHCREELVPAPYVQTEDDLLAAPSGNYRVVNHLMGEVLSYVTGVSP